MPRPTSALLPAPPAPAPPKPKLSALSDTWTSSSSGHQTADRRWPTGGAAGWRHLRESQLNRQLGGRRAPAPMPGKPTDAPPTDAPTTTSSSGIFAGLVVHVNGGTLPLVSDHRLRALLVEHGAAVATQLRRRQTTHVVVGAPSRGGAGAGSGGGLAAGKLHREIVGRGRAVKYVGADWVLESIRLGRRLPEAPYSRLKLAPAGQQSLYYMFQKT